MLSLFQVLGYAIFLFQLGGSFIESNFLIFLFIYFNFLCLPFGPTVSGYLISDGDCPYDEYYH